MSGRWPELVREPLPTRQITGDDIDDAFKLTTRFLRDPEDPKFDPVEFGFVLAARAALIECEEILSLNQISRQIAQEDGEPRSDHCRWQTIGEEMVARKVARRVIDALRQWIPERPS